MPKTFNEFEVGEKFVSPAITVTDAHITLFAGLSGDFNPLHVNDEFAKKTPFGARIAHGLLTITLMSGFMGMLVAGTAIAFLEARYKFLAPVKVGDTIHTEGEVVEKKPTSKYPGGVVRFKYEIKNQRGEVCVEGEAALLVADRVLY
ncbi:MAG: MaoC family dehydratase [Candidatus Freyarchaeota archaeon]|nr:MaoC/PaaZ C-terminal domain-containing protein [Candidatus Freyrarchaeum guaymaensis]